MIASMDCYDALDCFLDRLFDESEVFWGYGFDPVEPVTFLEKEYYFSRAI